ncbi:YerC/YecD family TrpR-related protein [Oceanobacillus sp. CFH 90083]|uniref:YerC/YecD family TrpR-related protein n=1 Tax=Oceanobacillus sp. CFH 90083 TaxID=2592336 RepID=UPI00128DEC82|nr:YerC/YecD family TrpR-related protein [Oceanobacillus sp. CFH 90083]
MQIDKLRGEQLDQLFDAILSLKTREECYQFFDDIATMSEIQSLSQRLQVAKMLTQGKTYNTIEQETKASTATISRVRRCINYGSDGYNLVLKRLDIKEESQQSKEESQPSKEK